MTTLLEALQQALAAELPDATYTVDDLKSPSGVSWLDFTGGPLDGVSVEIRPLEGYGLHTGPTPGFGSGPDKVVTSAREALDELKALHLGQPTPAN